VNRGKTERLLNLVFALMSSQRPVTRDDIRRSVAGYDPEASNEAFERMFERDKDELRSMGIPVRTVTNAFDEVLGYQIIQENYRLIDLNVSAREIQILSVSQSVWDQAVLGPAARSAVWKIEGSQQIESHTDQSLSSSTSHPQVGFARVRASEAAILPLLRAAREHKVVQFTYKPLGKELEKRTFEPWSVMCRSGRWYTVGFDVTRNEKRTFKLARIQGSVTVTAKEAVQANQWDGRENFKFPESDQTIDAVITVSHSHGAALRKAAVSIEKFVDHDVIHVNATEQDLVEWILVSLPEIQKIEPRSLHDSVVSVLTGMAANYHG
jgi:proteasome accessory factor B